MRPRFSIRRGCAGSRPSRGRWRTYKRSRRGRAKATGARKAAAAAIRCRGTRSRRMKHVIIGNGPAGVVAAETLRKNDPAAAITLIGEEPEPPYSRMALPYLMMGDIDEAGTNLRRDAGHYARR